MLAKSLSAGVLAATILSALVACPLAAQGEWTPLGPPGGTVPALVLHPDDPRILWAGTEGGGVFKSIDSGSSWTPVNRGLADLNVTTLAVAASDPDTLYAAAGVLPTVAGVFRSTDGGQSWTSASRGLPPPPPFCGCGSLSSIAELAVHPRNPDRVFAATSRGLYRTSDGGRRWFSLGFQGAVLSVAIDPVRPSIVYASTEDGIWKSTDGGASWNQVTSGQRIGVLLIDPENHRTVWGGGPQGLLRSTDGGATWRPLQPGFQVLSLALGPFDLPGQGISVLWAGTRRGVYRSLDGGTSWIRAGLRQWPVPSLVAHPDRPNVVWAGSGTGSTAGRGVFKTADSGISWRVSNRGLFALHTEAIAFDPVTPDVVWVGTAGLGVYRSDNRGATWTARNAGIAPLTISDLEVDPRDPETIWAASAGRGIYVTEDGGQTWMPRNQGLVLPGAQFPLPINVLKLAPSSPDIAYAGTRSGLFRTSDAEEQWTRLDTPFTQVVDVLADARDPDVVFVATGELWVSRDGTATWERVAIPAEPAAIVALAADPQDPDMIYAAGEEGVFRSADGGHTWQRVATSPVSGIVSLSVSTLGEVWAAGPSGAFRSPDGISGWARVPGLERTFPEEIAADPHDPDTVYAATFAGVFRH